MFKIRSQQKEMLDDAILDPVVLYENLKEFSIINKYLGTQQSLIDSLNTIYAKYSLQNSQQTLRIADLGCGAGDMLLSIHRWAQDKNIKIDILGIDCHQDIIEHAKKTVLNCSNIQILLLDILSDTFLESFDIVCLNNVCHHFSDTEIINLSKRLQSTTKLAIIINDLQRHPIAYFSIKWITRLFGLSRYAQHDGPLSVLKAFKIQDLKNYMAKTNTSYFDINKTWVFRWQMIIWCKENMT
jgi:2-polyprenyl-3-methyl-5-hydroxy-6-metoxy-1,4-benzoquinol methylase